MGKLSDVKIIAISLILSGCSIDPGGTWAPDLLKDRAAPAAQPDPMPDIKKMLKTRLSEFFLPGAGPTGISFTPPLRAGSAWETCIRATVNGAMGGSIGRQTYLVSILHDKVFREEKVDPSHWCMTAKFEPL